MAMQIKLVEKKKKTKKNKKPLHCKILEETFIAEINMEKGTVEGFKLRTCF
jgi:hypothetical protein